MSKNNLEDPFNKKQSQAPEDDDFMMESMNCMTISITSLVPTTHGRDNYNQPAYSKIIKPSAENYNFDRDLGSESSRFERGSFGTKTELGGGSDNKSHNLGTYNNGQFTKSYNGRVYNPNYHNKCMGFGKAKQPTEEQREKDRKLNRIHFWEILGCNGH